MVDLLIPFLLALTPIIWLVIALIGLKQQAWLASLESTTNTYIDFDITTLVNDWLKGTYPNYGFVLKAMQEAGYKEAGMQCEILNNKSREYGPEIVIEWGSKADQFLEELSLDGTTVKLRPMTEKTLNGMQKVDGVFADGHAKYDADVYYYVTAGESRSEVYVTKCLRRTVLSGPCVHGPSAK